MSRKIVAVLGVSGVGKTTMIQSFVQQHPDVLSVRASELIKRQAAITDAEKMRALTSLEIHINQNHLITAFDKFKLESPAQHILFDGHSIIDNDDEVIVIPTKVFEKIGPDLFIFIEDDPDIIASRRVHDTTRSRPLLSSQNLDAQQLVAKNAALNYGTELSIPCVVLSAGDKDKFNTLLSSVFDTDI